MQCSTQNLSANDKESLYEEEKNFGSHMQYIFDEEPYVTDFEISPGLIQFSIKHNEDVIDVFDGMLIEFNKGLEFSSLKSKNWCPFTCRPIILQVGECKYCVLFESINQDCIDLLKNIKSVEDISLEEK